jgi:hypothetical protein
MKVLFLCGSLEVGKDGVGDYTRQLSIELVKQEHQVQIVALNDNINAEHSEYLVVNAHQEIKLIRFSSSLTWENRIAKLDRLLNIFRPDWISLQYVPYSFQKKGVPYKFVKSLKLITKSWQWHIMFHETWIGISDLSPIKHKLIGSFQKQVAQLMITSVKPEKLSTSNRLYQLVLAKADIHTTVLPLFSNIPLCTTDLKIQTEIFKQLSVTTSNRDDFCIFGIFGKLHRGFDFQSVISEALITARSLNKNLIFLSFGRIGDIEEFNRLKSIFQSDVQFLLLGELSEKDISSTLQLLNIGISCTPFEHIGKSGVYAAMRLHNVEVMLPFSDRIPEFESEIKQYNSYLNSRPLHKWGVEHIAKKFVKLLNNI